MVLGVGDRECGQLRKRFEMLAPHYPKLRLLEAKDIARIEPAVAYSNGSLRNDEIVALGSENEYTAVNFEALARSFVRQAQRCKDKQVDVGYNQRVQHIKRQGDVLVWTANMEKTGDREVTARIEASQIKTPMDLVRRLAPRFEVIFDARGTQLFD